MQELKIGLKGFQEESVTPERTAARYGSGLVEVYATPAMIALMECTAMKSVLPYLDGNEGTVGAEVNVRHVKATPLGMQVRCESILSNVEGRKLTFDISAWDEEGLIGTGTHVRYIIDMKRFMEKLTKR